MNKLYKIFDGCPIKKLPKKRIFIYENDPIIELFYIKEGYVKAYNILENGSENIIFVYGPGDVFPLFTYLSAERRAKYFHECMTVVKLQIMSTEEFNKRIRNNSVLGEALLSYATDIGSQFIQRIDILSVNNTQRKIIALLTFLNEKTGTKNEFSRLSLPLTHQDIADMCGLTRETISIQIGNLKKMGLVSGSRHLVINSNKLSKAKVGLTI